MMSDFLDDDTADWQNSLAHLEDDNFDSIYNPSHHMPNNMRQANNLRSRGIPNEPQQPEDPDDSKVSDAFTYGPRFCQLFREYTVATNKTVNVDRHLMSLCTEHLVPFCKWARENEAKTNSIRATLLEYDYLRPEVRNGIVMVIIYTFASIKATRETGTDMFMTLQDPDRGLGIANKFSLKIYNDPFMYLSFLKITISALIDAGAIPDNERVNQPKRNKVMVENKEELEAYDQIQKRLLGLLDSGDNAGAKYVVLQITNYWQQRSRFIRNRKFVSVLHVLGVPGTVPGNMIPQSSSSSSSNNNSNNNNGSNNSNSNSNSSSSNNLNTVSNNVPHTHAVQHTHSSTNVNGHYHTPRTVTTLPNGEINRNPLCNSMGTNLLCCNTCGQLSSTVTSIDEETPVPKRMRAQPPTESSTQELVPVSNKPTAHHEISSGLSTSHYHVPTGRRCSPRPIDALRFERVAAYEWSIVETKVYDVCEFMKMLAMDMGDTPVCLIDESILQESPGLILRKQATKNGFGGIGYRSALEGVMSLTKELTMNNCMITSWTKADRPQLREMACQWQWQKHLPASESDGDNGLKDESMMSFWNSSDTTDFSMGGRNSCGGCAGKEGGRACDGEGQGIDDPCACGGESHSEIDQAARHSLGNGQDQRDNSNQSNSNHSNGNGSGNGSHQLQLQLQNQIQNHKNNSNGINNNGNGNGNSNLASNSHSNTNSNYGHMQNGNVNISTNMNTNGNAYQSTSAKPSEMSNSNSNFNTSGSVTMSMSMNTSHQRHSSSPRQSDLNSNHHFSSNYENRKPNNTTSQHAQFSLKNHLSHTTLSRAPFVHYQPKGYLVYEQILQVGVVIRSNPAIGLREDLWCVLFPTELSPLNPTESFGSLLSRLFPQLTSLYGTNEGDEGSRIASNESSKRAESNTAVKYFSHQKGHSLNHPPGSPSSSSYQTVGKVSFTASNLLSRIAAGPTFHDFVLSPILEVHTGHVGINRN